MESQIPDDPTLQAILFQNRMKNSVKGGALFGGSPGLFIPYGSLSFHAREIHLEMLPLGTRD